MRATSNLCVRAVRAQNSGEWRRTRAAYLRQQAASLERENFLSPEAQSLYAEAARLERAGK